MKYGTSQQLPSTQSKNTYQQLMMQYSDLEQEMYLQKNDTQVKYQQILSKIDGIYNELSNNINGLNTTSKNEYQQLMNELKQQRDQNIQLFQTLVTRSQKPVDDTLDFLEVQEQQLIDELQTLDTYKYKTNQERSIYNYQSPNRLYPISNIQPELKPYIQTPLLSTQYSSIQPQQIKTPTNYRSQRESYGIIQSNPIYIEQNQYIENQEQQHFQPKQNQQVQNQQQQHIKPFIFDKSPQHKISISHIEPEFQLKNSEKLKEEEQFRKDLEILRNQEQIKPQPSVIHQKEKIFDLSQLNTSREKSLLMQMQPNLINKSVQYQLSQQQLTEIDQQINLQNNQYIEEQQQQQIQFVPQQLNESQHSFVMDLHGNLGYDQFYQYLRQRYPINLITNKPNHGDQRILLKDQEALDLMQYVYCTMCEQFISIKQANNHTQFCMKQKNTIKHNDTYLDLFICCNNPQTLETKEQRIRRTCNELTKITYLIEYALKQKEYNSEQLKQKEYCLFGLEVLNQIIQNPKSNQLHQLQQDLISIYQVLDQQPQNYYKQIVFLFQKANSRLQQLTQ